MVKSVDTRDLKSLADKRPGSSPGERTKCPHCNDNGAFYDDYGAPIICSCMIPCVTCKSLGFEKSILPDQCTFCDGTFGGHPPEIVWCNTHNRLAERCKYEGGILLPCSKVNLLEHLELVDYADLSCVKLAE